MAHTVFLELVLLIGLATVIGGVMQLLKQPLIIGHIITGLIAGPYLLQIVQSRDTLELFSQIGIALLLFIIGLSLNPQIAREVGRVASITGIGQIVFTAGIGYYIALALGFAPLTAFYIALALTFSSTIIILKLLSDKKELNRLHGKIATGLLLVQDIVAALALLAVSALAQSSNLQEIALQTTVRGIGLIIVLVAISYFVLPKLDRFFAKAPELLFLFAISWGLGIGLMMQAVGFSVEIGALFAGVAMASSPYGAEITARLRPLRDFFIVIFFILLGTSMALGNIQAIWVAAVVLSVFILIGKPLVVMLLTKWLGYSKEVGFKAGIAIAQISEFSLILVALGYNVGHIDEGTVTLVTLVGIITIAASTYMIMYSDALFVRLAPFLGWFEKSHPIPDTHALKPSDVLVVGYKGIGQEFVGALNQIGANFTLVDYDPSVVHRLKERNIPCIYGDINNGDFLDAIDAIKSKVVITTLADHASNKLLTERLRSQNPHLIILAYAHDYRDARALYKSGATYVVTPQYMGTSKICSLIIKRGINKPAILLEKKAHLAFLKRQSLG